MNPLITILRNAHCRSTHHFFAVDALDLVQTGGGQRLKSILIRHHDRYLTGAKDPDTRFRDFQNHVIHVTDGYWGGAPRVAHQWYDRLQRYLRSDRWSDAAHAAGVLSHYFTDPMMPLHTQQCQREKILHRPIEWSVTKSYRSILKLWQDDQMRVVFNLSDKPSWLGEAILHGARYANQFFFPLMDTYDLGRGRKDPTEGLSLISKQALAELFGLAVTGWARVLERAAMDAEAARGVPLPVASTAVSLLLATARVPTRVWIRKLEHHRERKMVEALIAEFERTGDLRENLPAEVDIVHRVVKVYADEKVWAERRQQMQSKATVLQVHHPEPETPSTAEEVVSTGATTDREIDSASPVVRRAGSRLPDFRLHEDDPLVDAPSIGPRTAERFALIGISTVKQFLAGQPDDMASELSTRWINESLLQLWQTQATVMCAVPGLKCLSAQLLAGAGCQTAQSVAQHEPEKLHQAVSQYAMTSAGRRYLRGSLPPTLSEVEQWIENARSVQRDSTEAARRAA